MYNILEHKQAIAENIQKAFGDTPEDIEKAKWQIGEIRTDSRGIAHECYEYTAEGKPRLRRVKKNKSTSTTSTDNKKKDSKDDSKVSSLFKKVNSVKDKHQVNEKVELSDGLEMSVKYNYTDRFSGVSQYKVKVADRKIEDFVTFSVDGNKLTELYLQDKLEKVKKYFKREVEKKEVIKELDKVAKRYDVYNFFEDEKGGLLQVKLGGKAYGDSHNSYDEVVKFDKIDEVYDEDMYAITNYLKKKYKNDSKFNGVYFILDLD